LFCTIPLTVARVVPAEPKVCEAYYVKYLDLLYLSAQLTWWYTLTGAMMEESG